MKPRLVIVLLLYIFKVANARQEWIEKPKDVLVKEERDAVQGARCGIRLGDVSGGRMGVLFTCTLGNMNGKETLQLGTAR